ncbi:DUF4157 domain-containing protein [Undibacterium sp. SXout7W]|uniref:eCIS core domain-containing protein n=1 Tax=Undibacterium sp. SXout7W TaxID=3413049 RepID=UPI003BF21B1B
MKKYKPAQIKTMQRQADPIRSGINQHLPGAQIEDNRPQALAQREMQSALDQRPAVMQQKKMQVALHQNKTSPVTSPANKAGLPADLKAGIEALSGMNMNHVKVHYNSPKPAQINALAYAQGSDIHLAPGQEKHLPHEAWHVVQQARGRVKPTLQMAGGVLVNDNKGLESEADLMGQKAAANSSSQPASISAHITSPGTVPAQARALPPSLRPLIQASPGKGTVLQAFLGFAGGGWAAVGVGLPGALDNFPGGVNNVGSGQQAGATGRTIDLASTTPYAAPQKLGGFNYFSNLLTPKILNQPGGANKRYTHLHVINGKTHGPGTPNNLTLGSTGDNNAHRAQVEDHVRTALAAVDSATTYSAQIAMNPPDFVIGDVAYWNNPAAVVAGSQAAPPGSNKIVAGMKKPYTHSADPASAGKIGRWIHYQVDPVYVGGAISPTIGVNMAKTFKTLHDDEADDLRQRVRLKNGPKTYPIATSTAAQLAAAAIATGPALAAAPGATLAAACLAATGVLTPVIPLNSNAAYAQYKKNMADHVTNLNSFAAWVPQAFPQTLRCDADLYRPTFATPNIWSTRAEAQELIPVNRN